MIRTENLSFSVGDFRLHDISLEVADGEYFVLLGPPGSGKSVFLECLCGLNRPDSGRVLIDGREVTDLEPRERRVGYVPQDYALFPHLSVMRNISFGLRARGEPADLTRQRAEETAALLGIGHLLGRRVAGLSGGEKQRTALARALALGPAVLILDEPVSALDEATRESLCAELRRVQRASGVTTIHVSHNLEEAFSVADRGGVLEGGRFRQVGLLEDLLRRPRDDFVARFMRCANIFSGRAAGQEGELTRVAAEGCEFLVPGRHDGEVSFMVRPENLHLARPGGTGCGGPGAHLAVRLVRHVDRGAYVRAELAGAADFVAHMPYRAFAELAVSDGADLVVTVRPEAVHVLPE